MSAKPTQSWQDALLGLAANLPAGDDNMQPQEDTPAHKTALPRLTIELDRKGRAGKTATIVSGFGDETDPALVDELAAMLKKRLGTGGSSRGQEILIQGDRRNDVAKALADKGYKTRII